MDREKIIKAMEWCRENPCNGCPYEQNKDAEGRCTISDDTITLLKEQETIEPIPPIDESDLWKCGNCNHQLFRCTHQRYCENCGRSVKWK